MTHSRSALAALLFTLAMGCSSGGEQESPPAPWDNEPPGTVEGSGTVSVKIDGVAYEFPVFTAAYIPAFGDFQIDASNGDGGIGIYLPLDVNELGERTCDGSIPNSFFAVNIDHFQSSADAAGECSIWISEFGDVGETVRGTFSGPVGKPGSTQFVSGSFEIIRGSALRL